MSSDPRRVLPKSIRRESLRTGESVNDTLRLKQAFYQFQNESLRRTTPEEYQTSDSPGESREELLMRLLGGLRIQSRTTRRRYPRD